MKFPRLALFALCAAILANGCASKGPKRLSDADARVAGAMEYARLKTGRVERLPARWYSLPAKAQDGEGWWYILDAQGQPDACGKCQDNGDHFRVLIYVDPKTGWQHEAAWRHEAGHTMQRADEPDHEPRAWKNYFERW